VGRLAYILAVWLHTIQARIMFGRTLYFIPVACGLACAAALVPVETPSLPLKVGALEPNRGQAKPGILFLNRGATNVAVTAQSIHYSPLGVDQAFVGGNPNTVVSYSDPLPGVVNSFTGADKRNWITGIPRYRTAQLTSVYPGIDARYVVSATGDVTLKLLCSPGVDPSQIIFEIPTASAMFTQSDGSLYVGFGIGSPPHQPNLNLGSPSALQGTAVRSVTYDVSSNTPRFGFKVTGRDASAPLEIDFGLARSAFVDSDSLQYTKDTAGNALIAVPIPNASGVGAAFPDSSLLEGCSVGYWNPPACSDVAVYKFSPTGNLTFATYLGGKYVETPSFVGMTSAGAVVVTGNTASTDFPVTAAALQTTYGGPDPTVDLAAAGDYFAAKLDPATGNLTASTFLGGPNNDQVGATELGVDGSVYFYRFVPPSSLMPVTSGALQGACSGNPCQNGYAARLSPSLDQLVYGTYLPGAMRDGKLYSDGSLYFGGWAGAGFPTTPGAYQPQFGGGESDGTVARLNPQGSALIFGTYIGGGGSEGIYDIAVAPDGSVWGAVYDDQYRIVRLDSTGSHLLADKPIYADDLTVDPNGNLFAIAEGDFSVGPDAFLNARACGKAYLKLNSTGNQLFATYLPWGAAPTSFDGTSSDGTPLVKSWAGLYQIVEGESMSIFTGCVVDGASFSNNDATSPGALVTLFGSRMGPMQGVNFQLENGVVPTELAGTRVLVNGAPVPILYSSYWQVNIVLPYSLAQASRPTFQVESSSVAGNTIAPANVWPNGIAIFRADPSSNRPAAALNQDGTVNSPQNPARPGSVVMLFGTGGGATVPPSVAGELTPLTGLRLLEHQDIQVCIWSTTVCATVEYAGAAPGLVAGVTQLNVRLPDTIPPVDGFSPGLVPLVVSTQSSFYPGYVTVAVHWFSPPQFFQSQTD
jgi:uncharacterized protein (TIGR03437 family)